MLAGTFAILKIFNCFKSSLFLNYVPEKNEICMLWYCLTSSYSYCCNFHVYLCSEIL